MSKVEFGHPSETSLFQTWKVWALTSALVSSSPKENFTLRLYGQPPCKYFVCIQSEFHESFSSVQNIFCAFMRFRDSFGNGIQRSRIVITFPERLTPFCFPLKVDSMRENLSSEKLEDRVRRMQAQLNK